jgi:succinyl-diaminopimelate desuccinylase
MDHIKILKDLISIDTSVPPGNNYDRAIDYLQPLFLKTGFQTMKVEIPVEEAEGREGRVNLVCHRPEPGKPHLIFYSHIDVVPAQGWEAFNPREDAGKIYGRGAADMKGSISALLMALEKCKDSKLSYYTSVMVTTDEEYSQASQIRYLSRYLQPVKGAYFFDLDCSFGYVGIASLGALHMDILVKGKSVHSAMSHLGENAVEKAVLLMNALLKLKKQVVRRKSAVKADPASGIKHMQSRLNINMVQGGIKVNIVPDECLIAVDRRLIPEEDIEEARKELVETLKSVPGVEYEIKREMIIPTVPPCDDPVTDRLARVMREVIGQGNKYGEMGSGDMGNIVENEFGGKQFGLGVIRPDCNIHGKNEFVYIKDIQDLAEIIFRFLTADGG